MITAEFKSVIILLIVCSIFSWALIFDKIRLFKNINSSIEEFEKKFWKAKSAEGFNNNLPANSKDPATRIFKTAMNEVIKTKRQSSAVQAARVERIFLSILAELPRILAPSLVFIKILDLNLIFSDFLSKVKASVLIVTSPK